LFFSEGNKTHLALEGELDKAVIVDESNNTRVGRQSP